MAGASTASHGIDSQGRTSNQFPCNLSAPGFVLEAVSNYSQVPFTVSELLKGFFLSHK